MYDYTDVNNIIAPIESKLQVVATDICNCVKKGNLRFSVKDLRDFQTIKYLFSRETLVNVIMDEDVIALLLDLAQDIGRRCGINIISSTTSTSSDCAEDNIITEAGVCIITESSNNIISE